LIDLDMFFGYGKHRSPASSLVQGLHVAFFILAKIWYEAAGRRPMAHKIGSTNMIKILTMDDTILIINPLCELFTQLTNTKFLEKINIGAST